MLKKVVLICLLAVLAVATLITPASASPKDKPPLPTEGVMSPDPMYGSSEFLIDPNQATATGGLIMKGASTISNLGNGNVQIYGYTQTYSVADSIKVTVYLQKWTGSQWVDVTGVANSAAYTDYVSIGKPIAVSAGYYYRTRAVHTATSGTTTDTTYSTSSYIYI